MLNAYHYHLKDHLGNTRLTFTTAPKTIEFNAFYEDAASVTQGGVSVSNDMGSFEKIENIIDANIHDKTDAAATYTKSQKLTGASGAIIGSVLTIPVGKDDQISAEVYAKYLAATSTSNPVPSIAGLVIGAITGNTGTSNYESAIGGSVGADGSLINALGNGVSTNEPKAFINLMFLADDASEIGDFAYKQVTSSSSNAHAILALDQPFKAPSNGFVVVYLSNESSLLTEVYFDDLKVTVNETKIIQKDDFYPFGLAFANGYNRATAKRNDFLYNGKELQVDLGLQLYDYGARLYDPAIGRFTAPDPLADLYVGISPYSYALNNPINNVDRMGLDVVNAHADDLDKAKKELEAAKNARSGLGDDASKKERKAADKKVNQAQGNVDNQQSLFDSAQNQIDDLKNNHSEFFEALDNLTDAAGDKVDVSIGVQENLLFTGKNGFTSANILTTTDQNGQTIAVTKTLQDGTQIFTIVGGLSGKVNQIDIVIDSKYSTPGVASHEGGHAEYMAKYLTQYMNWIWDRMEEGKPMNNHDGHQFGDPSGKNADKKGEEYRQLNKEN